MSPKRSLRRAVPLLLLILAFASLPVQAVPRPGPGRAEIAVLGEKVAVWIRDLVTALWPQDSSKEGMSIDPDGQSSHQEEGDEGMTIDPNG